MHRSASSLFDSIANRDSAEMFTCPGTHEDDVEGNATRWKLGFLSAIRLHLSPFSTKKVQMRSQSCSETFAPKTSCNLFKLLLLKDSGGTQVSFFIDAVAFAQLSSLWKR